MNRLFFFMTVILFVSCSQKKTAYTISGHIEGINDSTIVFLYSLVDDQFIDSAYSINGYFSLYGKVKHPTGCWIKCEGEYANIQVENVDMTFVAQLENMSKNAIITGGKEQELQNRTMAFQKPIDISYNDAYDSLTNQLYSNDIDKQILIDKFYKAQNQSHEIYINQGIQNFESYYGSSIVYRNRKSIEKDTLEMLIERTSGLFADTEFVKALAVYLNSDIAQKGGGYIDFVATDVEGNDFQLSSIKDKYIYLTFWRSNCGYCRMENKVLRDGIEELPKDLVLVSFSTDMNKENWLRANNEDKINWTSVSDLKGEAGTIKTKYDVTGTPVSFLIDKSGIIIEQFSGFDKDIVKKLKTVIEVSEQHIRH